MGQENMFSKHPEILDLIAEYFAEIIFNELPIQKPNKDKGNIIFSDGKIDQREYTYRTVFGINLVRNGIYMESDLVERDFKEIVSQYSKIIHSDIATIEYFSRRESYLNIKKGFLAKILFESLDMRELPAYNEDIGRQFSDALAPHIKQKILMKPLSIYVGKEVKVYFNVSGYAFLNGYDYYGEEIWDESGDIYQCCVEFVSKDVVEEPTTPQAQAEYRKSKLQSW